MPPETPGWCTRSKIRWCVQDVEAWVCHATFAPKKVRNLIIRPLLITATIRDELAWVVGMQWLADSGGSAARPKQRRGIG